MGCSASRMEQGEAAAAAANAGSSSGNSAAAGIWPIRQVIGEVRRRTGGGPRVRKDSMVSAAELLLPVDPDAASDLDDSISGQRNPKAPAPAAEEARGGEGEEKRSTINQVDRAGDEEERGQLPDSLVKEEETMLPSPEVEKKQGEKEDLAAAVAIEEEDAPPPVELAEEEVPPLPAPSTMGRWEDLPASPSFRIYYVPRDSDEESVAVPWMNGTNKIEEKQEEEEEEEREKEKEEEEEEGDERDEKKTPETEEEKLPPQAEKSCDSNSCEFQLMKKADNKEDKEEHKGRRLKALWKAPYRMYRLFNVRNCYHQNGAATAGVSSAPSTSAAAPSIGRIHTDPDAAA